MNGVRSPSRSATVQTSPTVVDVKATSYQRSFGMSSGHGERPRKDEPST